MPFSKNWMSSVDKLKWALPTLVIVVLEEISTLNGISIPVPFLMVIASVIFAGSFGGQISGLIASIIASYLAIRSYFVKFGPYALTDDVLQVVVGSMLFFAIGITLGRLKDERDRSVQSFREIERELKLSLSDETAKSERQTSRAAESDARLEAAIRITGIGHFSFEAESGDCIYCSKQHAAHFGITPEEFISLSSGRNLQLSLIHEADQPMFIESMNRLDSGKAQAFEFRAKRPNGDIRYIRHIEEPVFDQSGKMIQSFGTSLDLTDLRLAEARVRQSQRIEAIGKLTGGVAHDFNNLLAIIIGNLELSLESNNRKDRDELTQSAINASLRGADLTKSLLSFSQKAVLQPRHLNLNELIQNTMTWSARALPANIEIEKSFASGLWEVELDQTSAETAIINILFNGRDAMPDGGRFKIETSNVQINTEYSAQRIEKIEPGDYVMLTISDTGHGIPSEKLEEIFEPFFTSKPFGQGSGLGLSMVQGFIEQSGGAIQVFSEEGIGTTFSLLFKAAKTQKISKQPMSAEILRQEHAQKTILLAEDEEEVMKVMRRILEDAGYLVWSAGNGDQALEVFQSSRPFDLLITDVMMPGSMLGPALAEATRLHNPDLPCIFVSGHMTEPTSSGNQPRHSDIFLMKPVSRKELLNAVSKALTNVC